MNKSDIHSFDKDLPTFSTEEPNFHVFTPPEHRINQKMPELKKDGFYSNTVSFFSLKLQ